MIWSIVSLIYPILILTVAMRCYKKDGRLMKAFYVRMAYHDVARRFYVLAVMMLLLVYLLSRQDAESMSLRHFCH